MVAWWSHCGHSTLQVDYGWKDWHQSKLDVHDYGVPTGVLNWLQKGVGKAWIPDTEWAAPPRDSRRPSVARDKALRERLEAEADLPIGRVPITRKRDRFTTDRGPSRARHHHKAYGNWQTQTL